MKPGNLNFQGAKSGGETKDEDSTVLFAHRIPVRFLFVQM